MPSRIRSATFALTMLAGLSAAGGSHGQETASEVRPAAYSTPKSTAPADPGQIELVRRLARQRGGQPAALAQIIQLARQFDDATAAEMIEELAAAHMRAGQLDLAATTRQMLVERYPAQPLARQSILWLVRLYASGEVAYVHGRHAPAADPAAVPSKTPAAANRVPAGAADRAERSATSANDGDGMALYALHLAGQATIQDPSLASDGAFAVARSVAAHKAQQTKASAAFLSPLKHRQAGDVWGDCARSEAWLLESQRGQPAKPVVRVALAETPPHLDGVLDESYWQRDPVAAPAAEPDEKSQAPSADVRWAYDVENLYVAVQCPKLAGVAYERDDRPRPHDGDIENHDGVRLKLDVDRDYASCYELTIDSRGWTADRCWGDAAWNPQWFVAAAESPDGRSWTIEAAIPWSQLVPHAPRNGDAWACAVERTAPGAAASREPADPGAFALLLFD